MVVPIGNVCKSTVKEFVVALQLHCLQTFKHIVHIVPQKPTFV